MPGDSTISKVLAVEATTPQDVLVTLVSGDAAVETTTQLD